MVSVAESHFDEWAAGDPDGGLLTWVVSEPGEGGQDGRQDLLALGGVGDRARGGREVGRRGLLEVEGERRVGDQVGVPGTGPAGVPVM